MQTIHAANNLEAKELNATHPQSTIVNDGNGDIWMGPATLRPVRKEPGSYLVYADHSTDCIGVVAKMESGLWGAHHYEEMVALRPTMRDAAIDLVQHTR